MKNSNDKSKQAAKKTPVKDMIGRIKKNKNMQDIYEFVEKKLWERVGCKSLKACIQKYGLPCVTTMYRRHKVGEYHVNFLPEIEIGEIKEGALRCFLKKTTSNTLKERVAKRINSLDIAPNKLTKADIESFLEKSKVQLNGKQLDAALGIAEEMVTSDLIQKVSGYMAESEMKRGRKKVFCEEIGRQVWKYLYNNA